MWQLAGPTSQLAVGPGWSHAPRSELALDLPNQSGCLPPALGSKDRASTESFCAIAVAGGSSPSAIALDHGEDRTEAQAVEVWSQRLEVGMTRSEYAAIGIRLSSQERPTYAESSAAIEAR